MASADFHTDIPQPLDLGSLAASAWISSGITHVLRPLPAGYTCIPSVTVSGSSIVADSPEIHASHPIPVRQAGALLSASSIEVVAFPDLPSC